MIKETTMRWLIVLISLLPISALAQTAEPVVPGYLTVTGCAGGIVPCFVPSVPGKSALNLGAGANLIKTGSGVVGQVCVITASAQTSSILDNTSGSVVAANVILTIPANAVAGSCYVLNFPVANGLSVNVGTSGVLSVSFQ